MPIKLIIAFFTWIAFINFSHAQSQLTLCADNSDWFPFIFVKGGKMTGLHVDIVEQALKNINVTLTVTPMPWTRCLKELESGNFDGVLTISYKNSRSDFLHFPIDASVKKHSDFRVSDVSYWLVTLKDADVYDGTAVSVPQPVRIPQDWSIANDLKLLGIQVDDGALSVRANARKLLRDKFGSLVATSDSFKYLVQDEFYREQLVLQSKPIKSKNYFLAFSKKSSVDQLMRQKIWQAIKDVRSDEILMLSWVRQYEF